MISGTHDNAIIGNVFTDIGGSGISVGKFTANDTTEVHIAYNPVDTNEICTNDTVKDNYVHDVTTEIEGGCGIIAGYPRGLDIEHNEVAYVNYSGISVGYGWTGSANAMSNNVIQYNDVHHVTQILADGSSIYTLSNQGPASQIQYNYVHDFGQSKWADFCCVHGLYLDEGSTGFTVEHNLMSNSPTDVFQNRTGANTVNDNSGNPSGAANTKATAGIEAAYADIKTRTAPFRPFDPSDAWPRPRRPKKCEMITTVQQEARVDDGPALLQHEDELPARVSPRLFVAVCTALPGAAAAKTFIDYFQPTPTACPVTSKTWGVSGVLPRDTCNGLENTNIPPAYYYWDGKIIPSPDGKYYMFADRWAGSTGFGNWGNSETIYAVSDALLGPYTDKGYAFNNGPDSGDPHKGHNCVGLRAP